MPSNYTGDPNATQSPSPTPDYGAMPILSRPVGGDARNAASIEQLVKALGDNVAFLLRGRLWEVVEAWASRDAGSDISTDATYLEGSPFKSIITSGAVGFGLTTDVLGDWNGTFCDLKPGTGNGNVAGMQTGNRLCLPGGTHNGSFRIEWRATKKTSVANQTITMGLFSDSTHLAVFRKTNSDTNWRCITDGGSGPTNNDSTVAPVVGTSQRFAIEVFGANHAEGARAKFYIDRVLRANITTNLPGAAGQFAYFHLTNTSGLGGAQNLRISPIEFGNAVK